ILVRGIPTKANIIWEKLVDVGYMKSLVFTTPVDTREELIARIEQAAATVRGRPVSLLRATTESWLRRAQLCLEHNGDNFEQFL
ncbi:hypothetical protein X777_17029, partial [Ooceraea biroi]